MMSSFLLRDGLAVEEDAHRVAVFRRAGGQQAHRALDIASPTARIREVRRRIGGFRYQGVIRRPCARGHESQGQSGRQELDQDSILHGMGLGVCFNKKPIGSFRFRIQILPSLEWLWILAT